MIFAFSVCDEKTFEAAKDLRCKPMLLIGCDADNEEKRVVTTQAAKDYAELLGAPYVECAARTGDGFEGILPSLIRQLGVEKSEKSGKKCCLQ